MVDANRVSFGLTPRLLVVLLAFGAVPLAMSIFVGYRISRTLLIDQAQHGMQELADQQAVQVATEFRREELLLRTIADWLSDSGHLTRQAPVIHANPVLEALPEIGAFDGLRLVRSDGRVEWQIGLRADVPHWPSQVPTTDWQRTDVAVHRSETDEFVAYLLAVRTPSPGPELWLEGHVAARDVPDLFALHEHTMGGAETGIFDEKGRLVLVGHSHSAADLRDVRSAIVADSSVGGVGHVTVHGEPHLVVQSIIEGVGWSLVAALPVELALEPLLRVRNAAAFGAVGLVFLILLTAWLAARSISMPLRTLAASAVSVGRGEAYIPVKHSGRDEIGLLAHAFQGMVADLADSSAQIEELHRKEMERAEQLASIGEMSSAIAHEIRNPLAGVLYAVELAGRRVTSDEDREMLSEAEAQLRRLEKTASQLLRYARPPDPKRMVVDARLLVDQAATIAGYQASAAGVELETTTGETTVSISADPDLLVQVLVNLILNGIQASDRGGVVRVMLVQRSGQAEFRVSDDGPGVSAEHESEIFRPFFTTKHAGTGLGLAISRQIVERHGGTLELRASAGDGALFVVSVPVSREKMRCTQ
ncbi:MAG: ATP-binding protein [Gemmatimonadota bacterium]